MNDVQQRTLRTILMGVPGFLALKSGTLTYEVANPRFCQFVAKSPAEIGGKSDRDLFPAEEASLSEKEDRAVMQTGVPRKVEQAFTGASGLHWFEVHRSPIFDDAGEPAGVLMAAFEITAYREREEALGRREARMEEMERQAAETAESAKRACDALAESEKRLAALESQLADCGRAAKASENRCAELEQAIESLQREKAHAETVATEAGTRADALQAKIQHYAADHAAAAALAEELAARLRG